MFSPFSKNNGPILKCKRDTHDLSFMNNLTMKFGNLYPVFVKEASAGDSWHFSSAFGLRFLPTFFPLQTKIRAKLDFFYVRNRNLYDDWKNWRFGTGSPSSFPTLSESELFEQSKTGSLGDYLGLPTTLVGGGVYSGRATASIPQSSSVNPSGGTVFDSKLTVSTNVVFFNPPYGNRYNFGVISNGSSSPFPASELDTWTTGGGWRTSSIQFPEELISGLGTLLHFGFASFTSGNLVLIEELTSQNFTSSGFLRINDYNNVVDKYLVFWQTSNFDVPVQELYPLSQYPSWNVHTTPSAFRVVEATSVFSKIPYSVSALPFRAYEQIYNAFYRDNRNNPFLVNGVYDPNVFLPTTKGGVDSTPYRLHQRNWEQDFLTSAVPSPQYGNAPLVGITSVSSSGVASLTLDDGSVVESKLSYDKDDVVTGFTTTRSASANSQLINLASQGISINDLRAVNSLQKYLELHYRRGLRYKDQMLAHRGIDIGYDVLDMPEFIGSCVQNIDVSQINQTFGSSDDSPLGSYAGQLSAVGGSKRLSKFCDEDGYIMGILSVVPVPCYSQLLPKHFTKINDPLEYFDPSFRNLGYQAIKYNEA